MADSNPPPHTSSNEEEPLLGRPGDVTQKPEQGLQFNFISGTAILAQAGVWILGGLVWAAVFENKVTFFSYHPLLQSLGLLLLIQAILVLQPTSTPTQKRHGTYIHSILNLLSLSAFIAGLVVIEMNKASHPETRFSSLHGKLGLVTFILISMQVAVGVVQFYFPSLVGGVEKGKALYKYHRASGYAILVLGLGTVAAATETGFNKNVLGIKLWAVLVASALVVVGVGARVKRGKLGL